MRVVAAGTVFRNPHPSYAPLQVAATSLCRSAVVDGGLLCAFRVGAAKLSADGSLRLAGSSDGGASWRALPTPLSLLADDGRNHTGFHLGACEGTTLLAGSRMAVAHYGTPQWESYESRIVDADTIIVRAQSHSWGDVQIYDFRRHDDEWAIPCGPPVALGGGRWILPMESHARSDRPDWLSHYYAFAAVSEDDGRSWSYCLETPSDPSGRFSYYDQRMALLPDGRLYTVAWVHDVIEDRTVTARAAYSEDGGASWAHDVDTRLLGGPVNPLTLPDGRLFAVFNHRRQPAGIVAVVSDDEGRTWSAERPLLLWDESRRAVTDEPWDAAGPESVPDALWEEMWGWTFGTPTPVATDDGLVVVTFHAASWDGVSEARTATIALDEAVGARR